MTTLCLLEFSVCRVLALVQYASITLRIRASSSRAAVPDGRDNDRVKQLKRSFFDILLHQLNILSIKCLLSKTFMSL